MLTVAGCMFSAHIRRMSCDLSLIALSAHRERIAALTLSRGEAQGRLRLNTQKEWGVW